MKTIEYSPSTRQTLNLFPSLRTEHSSTICPAFSMRAFSTESFGLWSFVASNTFPHCETTSKRESPIFTAVITSQCFEMAQIEATQPLSSRF